MPKYNRPGKLFSNCDDFRTYSVILYANCDIGAAWQYTKCLTLYCGCEGG